MGREPQSFVNLQPDGTFTYVKKVNIFDHIHYWIEPLYLQLCLALKKPLLEDYDSIELDDACDALKEDETFKSHFHRLFGGRPGRILWDIEDILSSELTPEYLEDSNYAREEFENQRMEKWDEVMIALVKRLPVRSQKNTLLALEDIIRTKAFPESVK